MKELTDDECVMLLEGYRHKLHILANKLYELTQEKPSNYQELLSRANDYRLEISKYVIRMNHIASDEAIVLKGLPEDEVDAYLKM